ncbi:methyltransferase domain-containing protein [Mycobacterium hodleri]|uniref:Methyltransferase domain-containing protein n=2 Tax=Mycolicibacterium hodleri TaxID=49897 RepID=A0A502E043_9MYCO|nr:methyltransferase domain-containing protein [Mycolicibacterium hodleri]
MHAMWASVAVSWGENASYVDTKGSSVAQAMLDAAHLRQGEHVLELACGPGGVGIAAAEIVGPDGAVVLSDFAQEMTAIAAGRARGRGLANVTTRELDLERIGYPDGSFDAVLCRDGLMLVADPATAMREARRVLRPAGRAVFAVWGPRERNPWLGVLFDAVTAQLGVTVPPPGIPGPFSLDAPGALEALMAPAGFTDYAVGEVPAPMHANTFDEWWSVIPSLAGPLAHLLASIPAEVAEAIRTDAEAALADFGTPDGYQLPGVSIVGVGRR